MAIRRAKSFQFSVEAKPGTLAAVTKVLKENEVDLSGLWGFGIGQGKGEIIAVPKDPEKFKQAATKAGWTVKESTCLEISGEDKVGALVEALDKVAAEGANLHALNAVTLSGQYGGTIWSEEIDKVAKILGV